jgi:hypothetical protein
MSIGSLDKKLYFGPTFLRGLIYVISVAIFITIFELCFYVIHIVPLEHDHVILKIQEAKKWNIDNVNHNIKNILKTLNEKNVNETKKSISVMLDKTNDENTNQSIKNILNSLTNENIDDTKKSIESILNSSHSINDIIELLDVKNLSSDKDMYGRSFVETMTDRELELNNKNNNNAIFFIVLEIVIFILFIFLVYQKLTTYVTSDKILNIGYNTHYGTGVLPPIINAFLTTLILAIFQINMYFFAQKWFYTSDYEIDYEITKNLDKYLN